MENWSNCRNLHWRLVDYARKCPEKHTSKSAQHWISQWEENTPVGNLQISLWLSGENVLSNHELWEKYVCRRIVKVKFRVPTLGNWISMNKEQQGPLLPVRSPGQLPDLGLDLEDNSSLSDKVKEWKLQVELEKGAKKKTYWQCLFGVCVYEEIFMRMCVFLGI